MENCKCCGKPSKYIRMISYPNMTELCEACDDLFSKAYTIGYEAAKRKYNVNPQEETQQQQ